MPAVFSEVVQYCEGVWGIAAVTDSGAVAKTSRVVAKEMTQEQALANHKELTRLVNQSSNVASLLHGGGPVANSRAEFDRGLSHTGVTYDETTRQTRKDPDKAKAELLTRYKKATPYTPPPTEPKENWGKNLDKLIEPSAPDLERDIHALTKMQELLKNGEPLKWTEVKKNTDPAKAEAMRELHGARKRFMEVALANTAAEFAKKMGFESVEPVVDFMEIDTDKGQIDVKKEALERDIEALQTTERELQEKLSSARADGGPDSEPFKKAQEEQQANQAALQAKYGELRRVVAEDSAELGAVAYQQAMFNDMRYREFKCKKPGSDETMTIVFFAPGSQKPTSDIDMQFICKEDPSATTKLIETFQEQSKKGLQDLSEATGIPIGDSLADVFDTNPYPAGMVIRPESGQVLNFADSFTPDAMADKNAADIGMGMIRHLETMDSADLESILPPKETRRESMLKSAAVGVDIALVSQINRAWNTFDAAMKKEPIRPQTEELLNRVAEKLGELRDAGLTDAINPVDAIVAPNPAEIKKRQKAMQELAHIMDELTADEQGKGLVAEGRNKAYMEAHAKVEDSIKARELVLVSQMTRITDLEAQIDPIQAEKNRQIEELKQANALTPEKQKEIEKAAEMQKTAERKRIDEDPVYKEKVETERAALEEELKKSLELAREASSKLAVEAHILHGMSNYNADEAYHNPGALGHTVEAGQMGRKTVKTAETSLSSMSADVGFIEEHVHHDGEDKPAGEFVFVVQKYIDRTIGALDDLDRKALDNVFDRAKLDENDQDIFEELATDFDKLNRDIAATRAVLAKKVGSVKLDKGKVTRTAPTDATFNKETMAELSAALQDATTQANALKKEGKPLDEATKMLVADVVSRVNDLAGGDGDFKAAAEEENNKNLVRVWSGKLKDIMASKMPDGEKQSKLSEVCAMVGMPDAGEIGKFMGKLLEAGANRFAEVKKETAETSVAQQEAKSEVNKGIAVSARVMKLKKLIAAVGDPYPAVFQKAEGMGLKEFKILLPKLNKAARDLRTKLERDMVTQGASLQQLRKDLETKKSELTTNKAVPERVEVIQREIDALTVRIQEAQRGLQEALVPLRARHTTLGDELKKYDEVAKDVDEQLAGA